MITPLKGAVGFVHSINLTDYTAKVKLAEYNNHITEDLTILTPLSFKNNLVALPKVNTPVFCIFLDDGTDRGYIIGSYFSDENLSTSKEDEYRINFQNSVITVKEDGNIELKGVLTTIDSDLKVTGEVTTDKNVNIAGDTSVQGMVTSAGGFSTSGASLKSGVLDVGTVQYKELSKK